VSFCEKGTVKAVLDPLTGRFPGNLGPDVLVDVRTSSLQAAIDAASDLNNDGYIIIGIIAAANGVPGGQATQEVEVSRAYAKPFAMIACGVTLNDPVSCDGRAVVHVRASATSPEFPVGSGVTLYFQDITVTGSSSAPGWLVEGDGRLLQEIGSQTNARGGVKIVGNRNAIRNSVVSNNVGGGVIVQGQSNTVYAVTANNNVGGDGIQVSGNSNTIAQSTAGNQGVGNGASGINVSGRGNLIESNGAFHNSASGISVSGGTGGSPNIVKNNVAGGPNRGNWGSGLVIGGSGQGAAGVVDIIGNIARSNAVNGFTVTGTGHRLKDNDSGGAGSSINLACQYKVAAGNFNATGNKRNGLLIPGANGSLFPTGCY
jgi:hypothetical protein